MQYLRGMDWRDLAERIKAGEYRAIARAITLVENNTPGADVFLEMLEFKPEIHVIGITGPPGAGKSSLVNAIAGHWLNNGHKVAIIAVDPSSPFNFGSVLGDRLRMAGLFLHPDVFIRSLSSRGSLGGLSASVIEVIDIFKQGGFDKIIVETVGVGQSEVEIAGVADCTVVVTVPESGDEVQTLKSGLMEIADVFVVNKCDREGADRFARFLKELAHSRLESQPEVILTAATENKGIQALADAIDHFLSMEKTNKRRYRLLAEKVGRLVIQRKMQGFDLEKIALELESASNNAGFNLYIYSRELSLNIK